MRKKFTMWVVLAVIAMTQLSCDSQASQQAKAQRHLDAALAKLAQANSGYVLSSSKGEGPGLQAYRQSSMDAVFDDLNEVMKLDAPAQKFQALRVSADIDISAARYAGREAASENAVLAGRSSTLLGYLGAFEGASSRSEALQPQEQTTLEKLQEEIDRQTARHKSQTAEAQALRDELENVHQQMARFKARADEGYAKAQALQDQSFVAQGERKYDLQDQATELQRQAAIESAAAEREQVIITDRSNRLELIQSQLALTDQLLAELNSQVKDTRARAAHLRDESTTAADVSAQAAETMSQEFAQIIEVHEQAVQRRMTEAGKRASKAIGALEQAMALASDQSDRQAVRFQLLAAYVEQAHITTSHAMFLGGLAHTTRMLAESTQRLTPQNAGVYTDRLDQLIQAQTDLNAQSDKAIEAGRALAAELAPEDADADDSPTVRIALQQRDRLDIYDQRRYDHEVH